jgi:GAF domain-containing protein
MGLIHRDRRDDVDVESCLANLDRLTAVRHSGLLDGTDHERLDALTQAASQRLETPMAFMSIVDDDRIVFAGMSGVTGELADTRQNVPEASYCTYVAAMDDVLVVNDSTADSLVHDHPATTDAGVRAYLGVPLRHAGQCLGSFCVVDVRARAWTDEDLAILESLAADAMAGVPSP